MAHFEARAVRDVLVSDVLEFAGDVRLYMVARIEASNDSGRCRLHLRALDGTRLSMLREQSDHVRVAVTPRKLPSRAEKRG